MSSDPTAVVSVVLSVLDHKAGVIGYLVAPHTTDQLRPEERRMQAELVYVRVCVDQTHVLPENMGPMINCINEKAGTTNLLEPNCSVSLPHLNVPSRERCDTHRTCGYTRHVVCQFS